MDKMEERQLMYAEGLSDREIARRQSVDRTAIVGWRQRNGLPANHARPCNSAAPMRRLLHDLGFGSAAIAKYQGCNPASVRDWRKRNNLPPCADKGRKDARLALRKLQTRIVKAIGRSLPPDIAADAAAALMMAVIEGTVRLGEIEKVAPRFRSHALTEYANAFAFSSLDQDLPNFEGLRPIDMLVDEASSDWLKEMGATVH